MRGNDTTMTETWRAWLVAAGAMVCAVACDTGSASLPETRAGGGGTPASAVAEGNGGAGTEADVGTLTIRRLNAVEYDNTVFDLLGDTRSFAASFPPDDGTGSFTNIGDALTISPLLFESYESAAEKLAAAASHDPKFVTCAPEDDPAPCATAILAPFVRRAWRRPVSGDEVARLVTMVSQAASDGAAFPEALAVAVKATLLSPHFLFRIELDPDPSSAEPHPLTDHELASRLSYFLWSTMPDDALSAYADAGKLSSPQVFDMQVRRMLKDPRANALVEIFASQWLLHTFGEVTRDPAVFPAYDATLAAAMGRETKAFLGAFMFGDLALADMLDARFTFLDATMAKHYGIDGVNGSTPVRVDLPADAHRAGLLTHASVLTMTGLATRTSPVRRGEWVLSELLCAPPPPPPPGIPPLKENVSVGTMRQRMDEHRKNPICATCHSQMDPIGFALENFDAIGRWRTTDQGEPIDASGQLPTGQTVLGAADLAAAIKSDRRFSACATRKLYTYALGRVPRPYDEARLVGLDASFVAGGMRVKDLISEIVHSDAFRMRRGGT